jgi:hypothetical protein
MWRCNPKAFLEWLWRLGERPCQVIDLTDMPVGSRRRAFSLSLLHPDEITQNGIPHRAERLGPTIREQCRSLWRRLRAENAPLRVVKADGLQSAPSPSSTSSCSHSPKPSGESPRGLSAK